MGGNMEATTTQVQNHEGGGLEQKSQDSTCRWQKSTLTFRARVNGTRRGGSASGMAGSRRSGDVCVIRWLSPHSVALPSLTLAHLGRAPQPQGPEQHRAHTHTRNPQFSGRRESLLPVAPGATHVSDWLMHLPGEEAGGHTKAPGQRDQRPGQATRGYVCWGRGALGGRGQRGQK